MRHEDKMRNVHFTCDACGDVLQNPAYRDRGEHDAPDVTAMIGNGNESLRFDMCPRCLKAFVSALKIGAAKRAQQIGPNHGTVGDVIDRLSPWNFQTSKLERPA